MTVNILSHHMGLQGSNLNMLDLDDYFQNTENINVNFYAFDVNDLTNVIFHSRRPHSFDNIFRLSVYNGNKDDITVTDFKTLIKLSQKNIKIICKDLYIIDNNELSYHLFDVKDAKFYHDVDANEMLKKHSFENVKFLFPPCDEEKFKEKYPNLKYEIFFKRINYRLLQKVPFENNNKLFFRSDDIDISDKIKNKYNIAETPEDETSLWNYKGLIYYRRKHLNYFEQLGRLIFEFLMIGKEVYFLNNPFEVNDGLSDYLKYYEIKFDKNYKIITTQEEIINKMNKRYTEFDFLKGN